MLLEQLLPWTKSVFSPVMVTVRKFPAIALSGSMLVMVGNFVISKPSCNVRTPPS
jgi:hypothetical protein